MSSTEDDLKAQTRAEWRALGDRMGLGWPEVRDIGRRTIEATFLGAEERAALLAAFDAAAASGPDGDAG